MIYIHVNDVVSTPLVFLRNVEPVESLRSGLVGIYLWMIPNYQL